MVFACTTKKERKQGRKTAKIGGKYTYFDISEGKNLEMSKFFCKFAKNFGKTELNGNKSYESKVDDIIG